MEAEIVLLSGGTPRLGLLSVALNLDAIVCGGERRGASWLVVSLPRNSFLLHRRIFILSTVVEFQGRKYYERT